MVCGLEQQYPWCHASAAISPPRAFIPPTAFSNGMAADSRETQWGAKQLMKMLWVTTVSSPSPPAVVVSDKGSPQNFQVFLAAKIVFGERDVCGFMTIDASCMPYFPMCTNHSLRELRQIETALKISSSRPLKYNRLSQSHIFLHSSLESVSRVNLDC